MTTSSMQPDSSGMELTPVVVTIEQAAKMLHVGRSTVYELINREQLEVIHIGRSARIPVDAIEQFVARLRTRSIDGSR